MRPQFDVMPAGPTLQKKFRSTGLQPSDREPLLQCIRAESDPIKLAGLLYMWGYTYSEEPAVKAVCVQYIVQPIPGLTATCLKLLCDYWNHWREYEEHLARYLNPKIYDEWYDEVIVAYSFVSRHPYGWSEETLRRYGTVQREEKRLELPHFD